MFRTLVALAALSSVLACPQHDYNIRAVENLHKRADVSLTWVYSYADTWGADNSKSSQFYVLIHD